MQQSSLRSTINGQVLKQLREKKAILRFEEYMLYVAVFFSLFRSQDHSISQVENILRG